MTPSGAIERVLKEVTLQDPVTEMDCSILKDEIASLLDEGQCDFQVDLDVFVRRTDLIVEAFVHGSGVSVCFRKFPIPQ